MSLSRSKPLRADRTHSWETQADMGAYRLFRCSRCHSHRRVRRRADLPEKWCNGLKQSELERTSRLSPVSRSNSAHRGEDDAFRRWVKRLPCVACGSPPPSDPHHVRTRNSGHSDWLITDGGRVGNLTPLCRSCHDSLDAVGGGKETFEAEHGIDLAGEARRLGERYRNHHEGGQNAGQD